MEFISEFKCDTIKQTVFHGRISLKICASAAASEFTERVQVGIDVCLYIYIYIPHKKYQLKLHSSPYFSAACAAVVVHKNQFFRLYQKEISSF